MVKAIIKTDRLELREFTITDAKWLLLLNSDSDVMQYTGDSPFNTLSEAKDFIQHYDHYKKYNFGRWVAHHKVSREWLGWCGLKFHEDSNEIDLGFRFLKTHWGNGYAYEAATGCIQYAFNELLLPALIGRAMISNAASVHLLEKLGMKKQKNFVENKVQWVQYVLCNPLNQPSR